MCVSKAVALLLSVAVTQVVHQLLHFILCRTGIFACNSQVSAALCSALWEGLAGFAAVHLCCCTDSPAA